MKLFNIENIPSFLNCVRKCEGIVVFEDRNGELHDLKALANTLDRVGHVFHGGKLDTLTVYAVNPDDQYRLINFVAEMALVS